MNEQLQMEHVFDIRIDFDMRKLFGPMVDGSQSGFTQVGGGTITGPLLNGTVVPHGGADWATVRADGVIDLNAHYLLETDDGTTIYIQNRGYLIPGDRPPGSTAMVQPKYFRVTPTFKVPVGPHDWLTRTVIVGTAERRSDPDHSLFRYFAVK
ncbi:MAG: DUF3237 domain-containing protein [Rhodanobacter sp.]